MRIRRTPVLLLMCSFFCTTNLLAKKPNLETQKINFSEGKNFELVEEDFRGKSDPVPGYIIKRSGERVEGEIIPGSITDNEVKVVFIPEGRDKKTTYKPKDLNAYGYEELQEDDLGIEYTSWVEYEVHKVDYPPKPFGPTTVFLKKEEAGSLTLFAYFIEVRNDPKNPYRYHYYLKDDNGKVQKIEKEDFRKTAAKAFGDYTAMAGKIGKSDFQYKNLDRMVRDYNYWMTNNHNANEYRVALKQ